MCQILHFGQLISSNLPLSRAPLNAAIKYYFVIPR